MEQLQGLKGWEYLLSQARAPTLPRAQLSRKSGGGVRGGPYLFSWFPFPWGPLPHHTGGWARDRAEGGRGCQRTRS